MSIDEDVVHEYASLMEGGYKFPELLVMFDGAEHWLVDGFHRRWAAIKAKIDKLACVVVDGTREHARWLSYSVNKDHGQPRTNEDKKKAVIAALKHPEGVKKSDRQIAEHVGVSSVMVAKYRKQSEPTVKDLQSPTRQGRDGRTTNTENIGKKGGKKSGPKQEPEVELPDEEEDQSEESQPADNRKSANTPFNHLCNWWKKADSAARTRFRLWIDGECT